jgi:hypothetical protein
MFVIFFTAIQRYGSVKKLGGENMPEGKEEKAKFEIKKARIESIRPFFDKKSQKNHDRCYATIDLGYFFLTNIVIDKDESSGDKNIMWNFDSACSTFKFNDTTIDNPYYSEVAKALRLISSELIKKQNEIIEFIENEETTRLEFLESEPLIDLEK